MPPRASAKSTLRVLGARSASAPPATTRCVALGGHEGRSLAICFYFIGRRQRQREREREKARERERAISLSLSPNEERESRKETDRVLSKEEGCVASSAALKKRRQKKTKKVQPRTRRARWGADELFVGEARLGPAARLQISRSSSQEERKTWSVSTAGFFLRARARALKEREMPKSEAERDDRDFGFGDSSWSSAKKHQEMRSPRAAL